MLFKIDASFLLQEACWLQEAHEMDDPSLVPDYASYLESEGYAYGYGDYLATTELPATTQQGTTKDALLSAREKWGSIYGVSATVEIELEIDGFPVVSCL